jgi:hypothetical protein
MLGLPLGIMVEGAVAVLLVLTIGYCILLNHRLKKLRSDRELLGKMITDLVQATGLANAAVMELKTAALEADTRLNERLEEAERFDLEFAAHISSGQLLMDKIAKITAAARRDPVVAAEMAGETGKAQSALQQLAMRARTRGHAA